MEKILLDTAILAVPNYAISEGNAQDLLERVLHYSEVACAETLFRIVLSDTAENDLWGNDFGPGPDQIKAFLNSAGLGQVFSANDLLKAYNTIFGRAIRSSDVGGFHPSSLDYYEEAPLLSSSLEPAALIPFTQQLLTATAVLRTFDESWSMGCAFKGHGVRQIKVKAVISEMDGPRAAEIGPTPVGAFGTAKTIATIEDFACETEVARLWGKASTLEEYFAAIQLGALSVRRAYDPKARPADILKFSFGKEFIPSLEAHDCSGGQKFGPLTLQRCTQIVADLGNVAAKDFGIRTADGAVGKRVHLTGDHAALRLMYWKCSQLIEFANVGVKKALKIEPGAPGSAYRADIGHLLIH